jgi:hypothetical protein
MMRKINWGSALDAKKASVSTFAPILVTTYHGTRIAKMELHAERPPRITLNLNNS